MSFWSHMNILIWFWRSSKWNLSNFWDQFHGCRLIITTGLKMVWRPMNCYQGVSKTWTIWSKKKIWKKITESHSRVAQVSWGWRQSCSSCKSWRGKIHPFFLTNAHYRYQKLRCNFFFTFYQYFSSSCILKSEACERTCVPHSEVSPR